MARWTSEPWGTAMGPRAGQPSHVQRIIVLLSLSKLCMEKNKPASPSAASVLLPFPVFGRLVFGLTFLVERIADRIASTMPVLFQPPLGPCMMGQVGLLV